MARGSRIFRISELACESATRNGTGPLAFRLPVAPRRLGQSEPESGTATASAVALAVPVHTGPGVAAGDAAAADEEEELSLALHCG